MNLEMSIQEFVTVATMPILILAAIGLATIAWIFLSAIKPVVSYLTSTRTVMLMTLLSLLVLAGGGFIGYSRYQFMGMCEGLGIVALIVPLVIGIPFWIRKWALWNYKETEPYN